jgi:hypothetical protein
MMANWKNRHLKIKHLLTKEDDYESIVKSMSAIADVLEKELHPKFYLVPKFRDIPKGDEVITALDYANKLLDMLYDYCDENRIWVE